MDYMTRCSCTLFVLLDTCLLYSERWRSTSPLRHIITTLSQHVTAQAEVTSSRNTQTEITTTELHDCLQVELIRAIVALQRWLLTKRMTATASAAAIMRPGSSVVTTGVHVVVSHQQCWVADEDACSQRTGGVFRTQGPVHLGYLAV